MERFPDELNDLYEDICYYTRKSTDTLVCTCVHKKSKKKVWIEWLCRVDEQFQYYYKRLRIWVDLLDHPCISKLFNVHLVGKYVYVVREFMESTLDTLIGVQTAEIIHIKYIMYQLLRLFSFLHSANAICMTLRSKYFGINTECELKLLRLPVAIRPVNNNDTSDDHELHDNLGHSAPELLFGVDYPDLTPAMNMWTIGVILAGLFNPHPLFRASSTMNTIEKIYNVLGPPTEQDLIEIKSPYATEMVNSIVDKIIMRDLNEIFSHAPDDALDLLKKLLAWSPKNRITAEEALNHPFVIEMNQYVPGTMDPPIMTVPSDSEIQDRIVNNPNYPSIMIKEINDKLLHREMFNTVMNMKVLAFNIARSSDACQLLPIELWQQIFASMASSNIYMDEHPNKETCERIARQMHEEYARRHKQTTSHY